MKYKIRKAEPGDIKEIIKLCAEHAGFEQAVYAAGGKAEKLSAFLFTDTPRIFCLLAENETGEILGYATFTPEFSTWDAAFYVHLDCLFLRPPARNFGIGERFIREIARFAQEQNCRQIQWQTPSFNKRGLKFYERLGAISKEKIRFVLDEKTIEELAG